VCCRYLLPPIIFYAGISVKKKQFFRNFASIATFGVLGTYIAFAVIACVLYGFSKLPNVLNFSVSFSQITVGTARHSLACAES
jgi:NhaP-type Na+/H+ or K+/H+ antiporter